MAGADAPDWGAITPTRFLGFCGPVSGGTSALFDFQPADYESAVMFRLPDDGSGDWTASVVSITTNRRTYSQRPLPGDWVIAPVCKADDPDWEIQLRNFGSVPLGCDVFAVSGLPITLLAPQANPIGVASRARAYDGFASHTPGGNTKATVTLGGVAGHRYVVSLVMGALRNTNAGAAVTQLLNLIDGPSGATTYLMQWRLACGAATGSGDSVNLVNTAFVGSVGTDLTLEFGAGPGANVTEQVQLAAYVIDGAAW